MSASAAVSVARSAGRGTTLRVQARPSTRPPSQNPTPSFRLPVSRNKLPVFTTDAQPKAQGAVAPRVGGRGSVLNKQRAVPGSGNASKAPTIPARRREVGVRSEFSASVLNRSADRSHSRNRDHRSDGRSVRASSGDPFAGAFAHGYGERFASRPADELEKGRTRARDEWFSAAAKKEALEAIDASMMPVETADTQEQGVPFAWGDLTAALNELPDGHWAEGFLRGSIATIEANSALAAKEKRAVLTQVLQTLAHISQQRFADAEIDGKAPRVGGHVDLLVKKKKQKVIKN